MIHICSIGAKYFTAWFIFAPLEQSISRCAPFSARVVQNGLRPDSLRKWDWAKGIRAEAVGNARGRRAGDYLVSENFMLMPKSCVMVGYELLESRGCERWRS